MIFTVTDARFVERGYDTHMQTFADANAVARLIDDLSVRIRGDLTGAVGDAPLADTCAMVGIRSRGDVMAQRLAAQLELPDDRVGSLDITLYRDDLSEVGPQPIVRTTEIPFAIDGLNIVLVDDVLMSGRSVRAAMQSLMDFGRPRRLWLAVLVDRGGRELPIQPDQVAVDMSNATTNNQQVAVTLTPTDERDAIIIQDCDGA